MGFLLLVTAAVICTAGVKIPQNHNVDQFKNKRIIIKMDRIVAQLAIRGGQ